MHFGFMDVILFNADLSNRAVKGLRPFAYWDCGFESRRWHGCLSLLNVVSCQVEVSVSGPIPHPEESCRVSVSECDREASVMGGPAPLGAVEPQ
jgi:hypothetical protein